MGADGVRVTGGVTNPVVSQKQVTTTYTSEATPFGGLTGLGGATNSGRVTNFKKTTTQFGSTLGSGLQGGSGLYQSGSEGNYSILKQLQDLQANGYQYT